MNPQEVSEMVGRQVQQGLQQVQQSLLEQLAKRLEDVQLGRPPPQTADARAPMGLDGLPADEEDADDNSVDGPDWSLYLTGAKTQPSTDAGSALSDLFGQPPALGLIQHTNPPGTAPELSGSASGRGPTKVGVRYALTSNSTTKTRPPGGIFAHRWCFCPQCL